jgi:hypothetical protein
MWNFLTDLEKVLGTLLPSSAEQEKRPIWKFVTNVAKVLGTLLLMVVCGVAAFMTTAATEIEFGLSDYEYQSKPAAVFAIVVGAIGFLFPAVIIWKPHKIDPSSQFSLRTLLIATTVVAIVLGLIGVVVRSLF